MAWERGYEVGDMNMLSMTDLVMISDEVKFNMEVFSDYDVHEVTHLQ